MFKALVGDFAMLASANKSTTANTEISLQTVDPNTLEGQIIALAKARAELKSAQSGLDLANTLNNTKAVSEVQSRINQINDQIIQHEEIAYEAIDGMLNNVFSFVDWNTMTADETTGPATVLNSLIRNVISYQTAIAQEKIDNPNASPEDIKAISNVTQAYDAVIAELDAFIDSLPDAQKPATPLVKIAIVASFADPILALKGQTGTPTGAKVTTPSLLSRIGSWFTAKSWFGLPRWGVIALAVAIPIVGYFAVTWAIGWATTLMGVAKIAAPTLAPAITSGSTATVPWGTWLAWGVGGVAVSIIIGIATFWNMNRMFKQFEATPVPRPGVTSPAPVTATKPKLFERLFGKKKVAVDNRPAADILGDQTPVPEKPKSTLAKIWDRTWSIINPGGSEWFVALRKSISTGFTYNRLRAWRLTVSVSQAVFIKLPAAFARVLSEGSAPILEPISNFFINWANLSEEAGYARSAWYRRSLWTRWLTPESTRDTLKELSKQYEFETNSLRDSERALKKALAAYRRSPAYKTSKEAPDLEPDGKTKTEVGKQKRLIVRHKRALEAIKSEIQKSVKPSISSRLIRFLAWPSNSTTGILAVAQFATQTVDDAFTYYVDGLNVEVSTAYDERESARAALARAPLPFFGGLDALWEIVIDPDRPIRKEVAALKKELKTIQTSERDVANRQRRRLEQRIKDLTAEMERKTNKKKDYAETEKTFNDLGIQISDLTRKIAEINAALSALTSADAVEKERLTGDLDAAEVALQNAESSQRALKFEDRKAQRDAYLARIAEQQTRLDMLNRSIAEIQSRIAFRTKMINELSKTVSQPYPPDVFDVISRLAAVAGFNTKYRSQVKTWAAQLASYYAGDALYAAAKTWHTTQTSIYSTAVKTSKAMSRLNVLAYVRQRDAFRRAEAKRQRLEDRLNDFDEKRDKYIVDDVPVVSAFTDAWNREILELEADIAKYEADIKQIQESGAIIDDIPDTDAEIEIERLKKLIAESKKSIADYDGYIENSAKLSTTLLVNTFREALVQSLKPIRT